MKYASILLLVLFSGCGASVHTEAVCVVPRPHKIKTVTVTEKVITPVPVYRDETTIQTQTHSEDDHGNPAAPLHDVKVKTQ